MTSAPYLPDQLSRESGRAAFGSDAAGYHAARSGYPPELYGHVFEHVPAQPRALEIGAGTGLVTEELLQRGVAAMTVVEPDPALVAFLAGRLPDTRLALVNAAFPDNGIVGPFDLIVCAAAFHWLEPVSAMARVRDLLAPRGTWAMWWNSYRNTAHGDALADAVTPLLKGIALPPSDSLHGHYSLDQALHRRTLTEAGFARVDYRLFRTERMLSTAQVLALYQTYSYIRLLDSGRRARFLDALADIVETRFAGQAPNLILTPLYRAR